MQDEQAGHPLPNADQAEHWNSETGHRWITCQEALDRHFAPLTEVLMARANARSGETVIDVGCGTGATTLELAAAAGADGSVLAIDISEQLLGVARRRVVRGGHRNVRFVRADAQTHRFERGRHDLAVSRFGVMFFEDPIGAFGNLARALRPGGRLVFVCWRRLEDNPWFALPLELGGGRLRPPEPRPPRAPGPLALAEQDYVEEILRSAGLVGIGIDPTDGFLHGAGSALEEAEFASQVGFLARLLKERDVDAATRRLLVDELADRLAPYLTPDGVRVPAGFHLVTAAAPA